MKGIYCDFRHNFQPVGGKSVMVRMILVAMLAWLLTACGGQVSGPSSEIVERAIGLQLSQTQQFLSQQLRLDSPVFAPKFDIKHVAIVNQQSLVIEKLSAFRVQGTYDLVIKTPQRQIVRTENPFEIYLQRQKEGKTWRLAQFKAESAAIGPRWVTQLISD